MKKRGFTLIELLAVIVILAIIALIATPIIMNIIENTKKGAAERSAENYLTAVELAIASKRLDGPVADGEYTIDGDGNLTGNGLEEPLKIKVSGSKPSAGGKILIENGQVVDKLTGDTTKKTTMTIGDYTASYNAEGKIEVSKGAGANNPVTVYRWSTDNISIGDTIIDPTDTTKFVTNYAELEKDFFLKHELDTDNRVIASYVCAKFGDDVACVRGGVDANGNSYYNENKSILEDLETKGFDCYLDDGDEEYGWSSSCGNKVYTSMRAKSDGFVYALSLDSCDVNLDGSSYCSFG